MPKPEVAALACPVSEDPDTRQRRRSRLDRALTDLHLRICAVLTVALFFIPPEGFYGIELCVFKRTTNLPCPGCGLTRCGSNLCRGHLVRAIEYNPFGLVIIPAMAGMGVFGLMPGRWRERVRSAYRPYSVALHRLAIVFTIAFVAFGVVRTAGIMAGWWQFPAQSP